MNGESIKRRRPTFTIFGGTGDLTYRKLLPALYNIFVSQQLVDFQIVIIGRREYTNQRYDAIIYEWLKKFARVRFDEERFTAFCERLYYYQMDFTQESTYIDLATFYRQHDMQEHIFYFAVAPHFFEIIAKGLTHVDKAQEGAVVIEKPFGKDLHSAQRLDAQLKTFFQADQIYHIDHYLGKEMVRNIQAIRFLNPIFATIWSHEYIDHVQISAMEEVGVETRGSYYDANGALKDMVQNHLFQILSIIAMEPSADGSGEHMRERQLAVLQQLRTVDQLDMKETLVLGQYEGYRKEAHVDKSSTVETYAALRLFIDNERWKDTPFYIRTGKRLNRREMEVIITFKRAHPKVDPNVLIIKIQPREGVYVRFNIKRPGNSEEIIPTTMNFCQSCNAIHRINTPEAYERLLMAVVQKDGAWFSNWEQIAVSWKYIDELKARAAGEVSIVPYEPSSSGPLEAQQLLTRHGHHWEQLIQEHTDNVLFETDI